MEPHNILYVPEPAPYLLLGGDLFLHNTHDVPKRARYLLYGRDLFRPLQTQIENRRPLDHFSKTSRWPTKKRQWQTSLGTELLEYSTDKDNGRTQQHSSKTLGHSTSIDFSLQSNRANDDLSLGYIETLGLSTPFDFSSQSFARISALRKGYYPIGRR